jgi:hypothetical protein
VIGQRGALSCCAAPAWHLRTSPELNRQALEHEQMVWVVHYCDEINKRNIISREIGTREDAMNKALEDLE